MPSIPLDAPLPKREVSHHAGHMTTMWDDEVSSAPMGASKNRRERVKLAVTGLANTGHVPSVRRRI